jgi:hypothetical protein|tara:strand:- start:1683 stop:2054 length:372 start_codon:yes stop_codon:yes gene_type:complete
MKISLLIISSLFVLGGCSILPKAQPVDVRTIAEIPPMYHPPLPLEIQGVPVKWKVLTPEIMEEYLALVKEGKAPAMPYYALTTQQYENLSVNMAEITRYTKNILSIVEYYRNYDQPKKENSDE